jgi:hypothetical protein
MLKRLLHFLSRNRIKSVPSGKASGVLNTFTWYIPAPPERKNGYREKEFDKAMKRFLRSGFEVVSLHTVPHHSQNGGGCWVIVLARALTHEALSSPVDEEDEDKNVEWDFQEEGR